MKRLNGVSALRLRRAALKAEIATIENKLAAMNAARGFFNDETPTAECVLGLLEENPSQIFTPAEIMEAVSRTEASVRKALTQLYTENRINRVKYARYQSWQS